MSPSGARNVFDPTCAGLLPEIPAVEGCDALWDDKDGRRWTRAALRAQALAMAGRFGLGRKKLIFLEADNRAATVIALLAAAAAGHAVALIDPALPRDKKARLLEAYGPEIVVTPGDPSVPLQVQEFNVEVGQSQIHGDLLLLLSTSGTTGSAKFVRLSASAVTANAQQIATVLDVGSTSVAIAHLPMHYSYGLSVVTSHLIVGGGVALIDDAVTSASFWTKVARSRGTHFPGVPFHYVTLARLGFGLVPPEVSTFTQAGGSLDIRFQRIVAERIIQRGGRFFVMYGQTEAAPRMTTLPHAKWETKCGSVGCALPGGMLEILDASGDKPQSEVGSAGPVLYRGPNVMMGYAETRSDLSVGDVMGGRLLTGDLGRLDVDGFLYLTGRTKRFAKIAGLRLGLDEIEREIGALLPVACVDAGEKIAVCFEGEAPDNLKAHLRAVATEYKIPPTSFKPHQLGAIPRMSSGKVDYAALGDAIRVRTSP